MWLRIGTIMKRSAGDDILNRPVETEVDDDEPSSGSSGHLSSTCWRWHKTTRRCSSTSVIVVEHIEANIFWGGTWCKKIEGHRPKCFKKPAKSLILLKETVPSGGESEREGGSWWTSINITWFFSSMNISTWFMSDRFSSAMALTSFVSLRLRGPFGQKLHIVCLIRRSVTVATSSSFLRIFSVFRPFTPKKFHYHR